MIQKHRNILINSSILFVIASILEMTLHESGHFIAAIMVNAKEISLHHNFVRFSNEELSISRHIIIAGAGPFVSLLIGILFHFIISKQTKRNLLFLFNVYMSGFGYIGFLGYLLIAPMFTGGDTGYICYALGSPMWLTILIAIIGAVLLYLVISKLMRYFVEMASIDIIELKETRNKFIKSILLYPVFIGIFITTLLNLPVPVYISLIAAICSPFSFLWGFGSVLDGKYSSELANKDMDSLLKLKLPIFIFLLLTIIVNRLLVFGIYFN